jgi:hypothetical protein
VSKERISFTLTLFNDEATVKKQAFLNNMECMFDDERNNVPDKYYELIENMALGEELEISITINRERPQIE